MNNSTLKSLLIEYDKKRINAENIAQKEKENLYTEFPELEEIDKKLSSLAFSSMIELTKNNDKKIIENLNSNIEALKKEKEKILNSIVERAKKIIQNYECKKLDISFVESVLKRFLNDIYLDKVKGRDIPYIYSGKELISSIDDITIYSNIIDR